MTRSTNSLWTTPSRSVLVRTFSLLLFCPQRADTSDSIFSSSSPLFCMPAVEINTKNKFTKDSCIGVVTIPKLSLDLDNATKEGWFPIFLPSKSSEDSPSTPMNDAKKPHAFSEKYVAMPRNCDHCSRLIWQSQGAFCDECGFVCHAKCQDQCKPSCGTVRPSFVSLSYGGESERRSNTTTTTERRASPPVSLHQRGRSPVACLLETARSCDGREHGNCHHLR